MGEIPPNLSPNETLLLGLDEGVSGAVYRVAMGFVFIPLQQFLFGTGGDWIVIAFFALFLFVLRLVPAVVRKLVRFSPQLKEAWALRRRMAKYYDCFQWRKLLWIGAGMAGYAVLAGTVRPVLLGLVVVCLLSGAAGTVIWRAVEADDKLPKPRFRKVKSPG